MGRWCLQPRKGLKLVEAIKFTVQLITAELKDTKLDAARRERGLFPEQVDRWRQEVQNANGKP